MNTLILLLLAAAVSMAAIDATPTDAVVEIEKQKLRLVKFPDDTVEAPPPPTAPPGPRPGSKEDEAKRILEEIAKINQALGYVKKQPEASRIPPILDSSQYLFPQPPQHPFHAQSHQIAGSNGETLLVPSIRAVKFAGDETSNAIVYNAPPTLRARPALTSASASVPATKLEAVALMKAPTRPLLNFRPHQVEVPQSLAERQQLPAHFVIPVRLYKLTKEEYVRRHAPREYRVKGYKIVGDIDHFYGKAKQKVKIEKLSTAKSTAPNYHLFFLPRELTLKEQTSTVTSSPLSMDGSREVKLTKVQTRPPSPATTNSASVTPAGQQSQIVRKRVVPKPATPTAAATTATASVAANPVGVQSNANKNNNNNFNFFNLRPSASNNNIVNNNNNNNNNKNDNKQERNSTTASPNAIKTAFQNIFKFPFRPALAQSQTPASDALTNLEMVPLQSPQRPLQTVVGGHQSMNDDYRWDSDNAASNSAAEEDDDDDDDNVGNYSAGVSSAHPDQLAEQKLFGHHLAHHHQQAQSTQREAIKQGGIIIQRLKVRKGGIAIAGPGGVATAGSGGTAIVGPGGYALTHPRSLTIAGPGAKVIAIPADTDLKDALLRTDLASGTWPREGKIVATGPTIYYSPATGASAEIHRANEPIIFEDSPFYRFRDGGSAGGSQRAQFAHNRSGAGGGGGSGSERAQPSYEQDFKTIQLAAARLVGIQEAARRKGTLSAEDNKIYADSLLELGQAAQNLAKLQQSGQIKDFSMLLQPLTLMPQKQPAHPSSGGGGGQKVEEVTEQHISEDDLLPATVDDPYEDLNDSVAITAPKKDASVAEAKPVGLSIAGEGGVASSKPSAVALSGRNGLAVAAPKATSIAGVSPEEAAAFSVSLPSRHHLVIKNSAAELHRQPQSTLQAASYDDYDYSDLAPVRPVVMRDVPLQPAVGNRLRSPPAAAKSPGDTFVSKWKTIIAEDYAASSLASGARNTERLAALKRTKKFALRSDDGRGVYIF